jgi:hypothetical protein
MNTKIKKQNPPKLEANSQFLIRNSKLFTFFRFPFRAVAERSGHRAEWYPELRRTELVECVEGSRCRSVRSPFSPGEICFAFHGAGVFRLPAVIRNSSFVIFFRSPFLLFPFALLLFTSCPEPTPPDHGLSLEAVDIVCTEATFKVSAGIDSTSIWECGLYRDDSLVISQSISGGSGYLRDTGLKPNASYNYHIGYLKEGKAKDRSQAVSITTLDTTSHDFTWIVETLGDYGSYLNDVAIVDENNIWVVGYIEIGDSIYNAAHWNGNEWEMVQILRPVDFEGVFALSANDIWFADGCKIFHYDGNQFTEMWMCDWERHGVNQATSIWASSPEDVWFVGDNGSIVHYDGSGFQRRESGTETDLTDIKGTPAGYPIYISGRNTHGDNYESPFIQIREDKSLHTLYRSNYPWGNEENWGDIEAIGVSASHVYISPWGRDMVIYNYYFNEFNEYNYRSIPAFYGTRVVDISLVNDNEIYLFDLWGSIIYYNGIKWTLDNSIYHQFGDNNFIVRGSDAIQNYTVVVGKRLSTDQGIVAIGTQY